MGSCRQLLPAQDRRGASGQLLTTLRVNNDLFCDMAALVALNDTSLRQAAAQKADTDGALAGVIAKAADSAATAGRRLLRQVLPGSGDSAAGREAALEQPSSETGSRVVSSKWRQARSGDSSRVRRLQQQLQREAREQRLQQEQPHDEQQQQQAESAAEESAAEGSAARGQAQRSGEDASQQAEDSGLPVMSGGTTLAVLHATIWLLVLTGAPLL